MVTPRDNRASLGIALRYPSCSQPPGMALGQFRWAGEQIWRGLWGLSFSKQLGERMHPGISSGAGAKLLPPPLSDVVHRLSTAGKDSLGNAGDLVQRISAWHRSAPVQESDQRGALPAWHHIFGHSKPCPGGTQPGRAAQHANPCRLRPGGNPELAAPLPAPCLIKRDWPTRISVVVCLSQTHPSR